MDAWWIPVFALMAFAAATLLRVRAARRSLAFQARRVEAERLLALLSDQQPGVWDAETLKGLIAQVSAAFVSPPSREALERLAPWVASDVLAARTQRFGRRHPAVKAISVAILQLQEGGDAPDQVVARVRLRRAGRAVAPRAGLLFETWRHHDGHGWRLEALASATEPDLPPSFSVSCRVMPSAGSEVSQP